MAEELKNSVEKTLAVFGSIQTEMDDLKPFRGFHRVVKRTTSGEMEGKMVDICPKLHIAISIKTGRKNGQCALHLYLENIWQEYLGIIYVCII